MSLQKLIEKMKLEIGSEHLTDYMTVAITAKDILKLCKAAEVMRERLEQFCGCDLTPECICCNCKTVLEADQICAEGE